MNATRLIVLASLVALPCISQAAAPFDVPTIVVRPIQGGHEVEITVPRVAGVAAPTGEVPYTVEPYDIAIPAGRKLMQEADILGTGLSMDLDGDGNTTGQIPLTCNSDGSVTAGGVRYVPLGLPVMTYRAKDGAPVSARMGERGAYGVLYRSCKEDGPIGFGLSPADKPIRIETTKGPLLQILVAEEAKGPEDQVAFSVGAVTVDGAKVSPKLRSVADYEPMFEADPSWANLRWTMLPFAKDRAEHRVTVQVLSTDPSRRRMVIAIVNWSERAGERTRGKVAGMPLP